MLRQESRVTGAWACKPAADSGMKLAMASSAVNISFNFMVETCCGK